MTDFCELTDTEEHALFERDRIGWEKYRVQKWRHRLAALSGDAKRSAWNRLPKCVRDELTRLAKQEQAQQLAGDLDSL